MVNFLSGIYRFFGEFYRLKMRSLLFTTPTTDSIHQKVFVCVCLRGSVLALRFIISF
jgi:hypothetical protein